MASSNSNLESSVAGLRCAAVSDVGMRRASNQDSYAVALADSSQQWQRRGHLFVVADGMGAHAAGELASKMAIDSIPHSYQKQTNLSPSESIEKAVRGANTAIYGKGESSIDFKGMGTTCSCLLLLPSGALAAHVGDSRIYRLRDDRFEQLTFDHSLVWEMAAAGGATEEDVPAFVPKNVITRSLGPHAEVAVDIEGPFPLQSGDRFLLCSDGLTGPLKSELIGMVLGALSPVDAAQTLVDLANLLGGPDNITVITAEVADAQDLHEVDAQHAPQFGKNGRARSNLGDWASRLLGGVALVASIALALGGMTTWAIGSGAVALIAFAVAIALRQKAGCELAGEEPAFLHDRSPYRQYCSAPTAENLETLSDIVRQLEDLEEERDWKLDWQPIRDDRMRASEAIAKGDFSTAVVSYCSAVRRLMAEVREKNLAAPSDSSIGL